MTRDQWLDVVCAAYFMYEERSVEGRLEAVAGEVAARVEEDPEW